MPSASGCSVGIVYARACTDSIAGPAEGCLSEGGLSEGGLSEGCLSEGCLSEGCLSEGGDIRQ